MFQKLTEKEEKGKKLPVVAVVADVLEKNKMSEKKFKYTDEDIERLVSLYNEARKRRQRQERQRTGSSTTTTTSSSTNDEIKIEQLHDKRKNREKFKAKELSYMISIKTKRVNMYDFLKNLEKLFRHLLAIAKMNTASDDDYVRFFFEKSPTRPFSTAIVKLKDLNVRYFMDTFERMLNSGENILADGWNTVVSIAIFSADDKQRQKTKAKTRHKKIYTFLRKGADDGGGGKKILKKIIVVLDMVLFKSSARVSTAFVVFLLLCLSLSLF